MKLLFYARPTYGATEIITAATINRGRVNFSIVLRYTGYGILTISHMPILVDSGYIPHTKFIPTVKEDITEVLHLNS